MFTQQFRVSLEQGDGTARDTKITADQRDLAQLELQPWHGVEGKRMVHNGLRHLAFTALQRAGTPEVKGIDYETFNTRICIEVEALDDDDEGADTDPNPRGPITTSAGS